MAMQLTMKCMAPCAARATRLLERAKLLGVRAAAVAFALAGLFVIVYGERWVLSQSPVAASPLVVATCVVDALAGGRASACSNAEAKVEKRSALPRGAARHWSVDGRSSATGARRKSSVAGNEGLRASN